VQIVGLITPIPYSVAWYDDENNNSCSSIYYIRSNGSEQVWLPRLDSVSSLRTRCLGMSKELVMSAVISVLATIWCSLSSSTVMETGFTCFYTISISRSGKAFI